MRVVTDLDELHREKALHRQLLESELESVKDQLIAMGAQKLILFGSFAHGKVRRSSDLDLIAVMPATRTGREWMREIYSNLDRGVDCDILAYTEDELRETARISRFVRNALSTGRIIHGA
ncbi:MAG: nucleotidyltransferase domain-containing protein [Actinobacteria bacterium]|nr:nucleotidyltransferase domain-containing protein [Actinomycetota bacterium]MBU1943667.1 nucleotidyltransferase domain-containing protein [Actinomycetota bacterium]MBU2686189.1 nucleotidyltransferase domain-containing protein [Actinomycetota bacterium]